MTCSSSRQLSRLKKDRTVIIALEAGALYQAIDKDTYQMPYQKLGTADEERGRYQ